MPSNRKSNRPGDDNARPRHEEPHAQDAKPPGEQGQVNDEFDENSAGSPGTGRGHRSTTDSDRPARTVPGQAGSARDDEGSDSGARGGQDASRSADTGGRSTRAGMSPQTGQQHNQERNQRK